MALNAHAGDFGFDPLKLGKIILVYDDDCVKCFSYCKAKTLKKKGNMLRNISQDTDFLQLYQGASVLIKYI